MNKDMQPEESDNQVNDMQKAPSVEDERTELDKKLEQIESIEMREERSRKEGVLLSDRQAMGGDRMPADDNMQSPEEDPAIVAARLAMRNAERSDLKKSVGQKKHRVVTLVLAVLLIIFGAIVAWLFYMQKTTETQLSSVQSSLEDTELKLARAESSTTQPVPEAKPVDNSGEESESFPGKQYRSILEWGVRYELTEAAKDIGYGLFVIEPQESMGFYSMKIARSAGIQAQTQELRCGVGSSGLIMRLSDAQLSKLFPAQEQLAQVAHKKVGDYTYVYQMPQGTCSDSVEEEKAASDAVRGLVATLEAVPEEG